MPFYLLPTLRPSTPQDLAREFCCLVWSPLSSSELWLAMAAGFKLAQLRWCISCWPSAGSSREATNRWGGLTHPPQAAWASAQHGSCLPKRKHLQCLKADTGHLLEPALGVASPHFCVLHIHLFYFYSTFKWSHIVFAILWLISLNLIPSRLP